MQKIRTRNLVLAALFLALALLLPFLTGQIPQIGKMISPQSIAIGTAATATVGNESKILRKVMKYCAIFIVIAGCVAYAVSRMR